jgi:2-polyprenyl-6-methoxyphenol hydroxylase-like FAD-dependent oxidoreductase
MTAGAAEIPVLIVGGGPAGLTASLLLSRHGVESLLVDKRATGSPLPRARGVHARAMEILRVCGVEPDLRAVELPITPGA